MIGKDDHRAHPKAAAAQGDLKIDIGSSSFSEVRKAEDGPLVIRKLSQHQARDPGRKRQDAGAEAIKKEGPDHGSDRVSSSLRSSVLEGTLTSAGGSIQGSFATPLALSLNATNAEVGLMNSLMCLASTVSLIPGAMLTKYYGRKAIWVASQLVSRVFIWFPILLLPLLPSGDAVLLLIALLAVSSFCLEIRGPAWSSLMGDIVPAAMKGRYFGRRNFAMGISGMAATLFAGLLLAGYGFQAIFLLSIALSAASVIFFRRVHEPPLRLAFHYRYSFSFSPRGWLAGMALNRNLTFFTVYVTLMNFAVCISSPFYAVYMLRNLDIGYGWFAVVVVVGALSNALTQRYWGRLNDRYGSRKILVTCGALACFVPFMWIFVSGIGQILLIKLYDGFVYAGFDSVIFNYLLDSAPAKNRPKHIANHSFFAGMGEVFGSLFGALLASGIGGASFLMLSGLQIIFAISFAARMACLSVLPMVGEIKIRQTQVAPVRYVFWQAVAVEPIRGIQNAIGFTFRYPARVERELRENAKSLRFRLKMRMG